ncbi:Regulatory protein LuxO [Pirellula sp. SH-Sr6A]|uniref:sigma-54-dependent transcriptional regulator n=1 Tax=Pirellula sp. SH-Sr6A TaxID=1632865 RepID=UPI00078B4003|nr:sigma 54-interacting transcriptional regulator [Pirellula sp. SH-Sr6A]AMV35343.1 Regulatory protein LuxO [Pirellula sp. SH-Sr6A]
MTNLRTTESDYLPRILIIDDQYGRSLKDGTQNDLRHTWRRTHGLLDATGDASASKSKPRGETVARAFFFSGQSPSPVGIGDEISNDLPAILQTVREGWVCKPEDRWALVLVDMEFVTGIITEESSRDEAGAPSKSPIGQAATEYFGLKIIEAIKTEYPDLPVVILSSNKQNQDAISERYEGQGVKVFIDKQCTAEELQNYIWEEGLVPDELGLSLGYSLPLLKALRIARKVGRTRSPVLITGQSGTGKQPLAEYLMQWSAKSTNGPQISFNCAKLKTETGVSQLFGHVKGAFTNAISDKKGLLEAADGGDLFLDELSWLNLENQSRLLKVIEDGRLTRLGEDEDKVKNVDVRVICGTNADLDLLVQEGKFLHDLLFRLDVVSIELPPLSQRFEDLELIVNGLIRKFDKQAIPRKIGAGLIPYLMSYSWPGNIRELSNMVERACVLDQESRHLLSRDMPLPVAVSPDVPNAGQVSGQHPGVHEALALDGALSASVAVPPNPEMSVEDFIQFLANVRLTADSDEELRGMFGSGRNVLGRYETASNTAITRLVLLALEKCVSEGDARNLEFNFAKTIQLLVDANVKTTKFNRFVETHCLSVEGPVGEQFKRAWEKKKAFTKPSNETTA